MNQPKEIGAYIRQLRNLEELTQEELATKIGVKKSTYTHFETGRTNMTLQTLNKISDALGYDLQVSFSLKRAADKV